ncbi:hypothetical protein HKK72_24680 [Actinomadura sp. HBU206391]|nr:hypothetical protein [Actinomadura sp. HBU206391]
MSRRVGGYLGSTKNLVGSVCGLIGLGLYLAGAVGSYWPFVVAGLYAAGALAAPPEKVTLVLELEDASAETGLLRADLDRMVERVAAHAGRMPPPAMVRFRDIIEMLRELLARADALTADPDALHEVVRVIRTDLPEGFESYLNLPGWFAAGRGGGERRTAADELNAQLGLIADQVRRTAERVYETDAQRLRDQTRYLQERGRRSGLDLPASPDS